MESIQAERRIKLTLTREQFRKAVFDRDEHLCVMCSRSGKDAHHIIERRLWPDGGYYVENGVTLCEECHLAAEGTSISCEMIRQFAGIDKVVLPPHFYPDERYDKWGNVFLPTGKRMRGELFHDESVQKVLAPVLDEFTQYVKHPRTWHLPWSAAITKDDRTLAPFTVASWDGNETVVTEKMDGENTTMYRNYVHARSVDYSSHPSRTRIKALHAEIGHSIPNGWRICGENLAAVHSIHYNRLPSFFLVFSIWDERNVCLSWDDTVLYAATLGLNTVPVRWRGIWRTQTIPDAISEPRNRFIQGEVEGYVVRPLEEFPYGEYSCRVGKSVRAYHVQTHGHWMRSKLEWNGVME